MSRIALTRMSYGFPHEPNYSAPVGERSIAIGLCVCMCVSACVSASISLEPLNRSSRNFCADPLWGWLGPLLEALRYVMYFRFMDDVTFGRIAMRD